MYVVVLYIFASVEYQRPTSNPLFIPITKAIDAVTFHHKTFLRSRNGTGGGKRRRVALHVFMGLTNMSTLMWAGCEETQIRFYCSMCSDLI